MAMQMLTAVFRSRDGAIAAASELRRRGFSSNVVVFPEAAGISTDAAMDAGRFLAWFEKLLGSETDRDAYSQALECGDTVIVAVVPPTGFHSCIGVLDHHLAIRVDRCHRAWCDTQDDGALPIDDHPVVFSKRSGADQIDWRALTQGDPIRSRSPTDEATLTKSAQYLSRLPFEDDRSGP